jgi:formylglycine-generating enzyme required for sulfatase activity
MTDTPTEFDEILPAEAVSIKLLKIPAGSFLMGSPPESNSDYEKPQHLVTLESFWLSQIPITQAQWSIVANWPTVNVPLKPNPSYFKGPNKPLEQVSWEDAIEFCNRLCQRTGRYYSLPSEAQWEYACRAGTTTPFHFGETISSELANYNGNYTYGKGQKGVYRKQTTNAGSFPANAWGLHDMHGNVWEWCADHWHDNYNGAPADGSPWTNDTNYVGTRLLRGGSWSSNPGICRSAYRSSSPPGFQLGNVGFRVCCLP